MPHRGGAVWRRGGASARTEFVLSAEIGAVSEVQEATAILCFDVSTFSLSSSFVDVMVLFVHAADVQLKVETRGVGKDL